MDENDYINKYFFLEKEIMLTCLEDSNNLFEIKSLSSLIYLNRGTIKYIFI